MKIRDLVPWRSRDVMEWSSDNPFYTLQRDMNRMFDEFWREFDLPTVWRRGQGFMPCVDVAETDQAIEVTAELPGMTEEDIELTMADNVLTIKGEKKHFDEEKSESFYRVERSFGSFTRAIPVPVTLVDQENISADFENGVLTITLPKLPEAQKATRQIPIKTN